MNLGLDIYRMFCQLFLVSTNFDISLKANLLSLILYSIDILCFSLDIFTVSVLVLALVFVSTSRLRELQFCSWYWHSKTVVWVSSLRLRPLLPQSQHRDFVSSSLGFEIKTQKPLVLVSVLKVQTYSRWSLK